MVHVTEIRSICENGAFFIVALSSLHLPAFLVFIRSVFVIFGRDFPMQQVDGADGSVRDDNIWPRLSF